MLITSIPKSYECLNNKKLAFKPVTKLQLKPQPACDQVNFSGKKGYKFDLKNMTNLPCAYCAKTMITTDEQIRFGIKLANLRGKNLNKALEFIATQDQFPIEQRVAKLLIRQSKQSPDKDAQELLMSAFPWAEKKLVKQQKTILDNLPEFINNLTGPTKTIIQRKFKEINLILNHCTPDYIFKKKAAVRGFHKVFGDEQDPKNQELLSESLNILATLPTSRNNLEAFVVKYSRRGPREIGERLLDPFLSSTEHIEPNSENGVSKPYNYLVAHKDCNEKRGSEPFHLFVHDNPQIIPNIGNQIKIITKKIENFETFGLENYPIQVARTLKKLSHGQIDIDMSGFTPPDKTVRTFIELGNKRPQKNIPAKNKTWLHPNINSGASSNQTTKTKLNKQAQKEMEIKKLFALLKSSAPEQTSTPPPIIKKKLKPSIEPIKPKEENTTEILKKELINMFEAQPLKDLKTQIRSEIIARESATNKEILNTNSALLSEKAKEEARISNWTQKIYSSIQKEKQAKGEKKKQEIVDLFISSPIEGLKEKIRTEIISKESDHVKSILKIGLDVPNERIIIEKKISNWTREIYSLVQKMQKAPKATTEDKILQNNTTETKILKKEIASLFINSPEEGLAEKIRTEIISRESDKNKKILGVDPELLNKRIKIEKRISELTNELYSSILLKKKSISNHTNQINITEEPKISAVRKSESEDDKKKREIFELFFSSNEKDLKEKIRAEIISRESDRVKELLALNSQLLDNKNNLEKKISNLTKQIYDAVEKKQNENPQLKAKEPQNNESNQTNTLKKMKNSVIISNQQLQEALGNKKTGNLRQLKKRLKKQITQKGNS